MSNKKQLNQVILLHPNTYYLMLENQVSTDFITRKLIPYLNDKSTTDFNKWIKIKQELNMFMQRKTKPYKSNIEHQKSILDEKAFNETVNPEPNILKNHINANDDPDNDINHNKFEQNEKFFTSTPMLHIKKKYIKFYGNNEENKTIDDFKKLSSKPIDENSDDSKKKRKSHQESPVEDIDETDLENKTTENPKSKTKRNRKSNKKPTKTNGQFAYNTRSVQKGESWIKWIPLY